jgi:hypothetical protein
MVAERTSQDWFDEAARCYVEHHQGCAWCGGSYRVYQIRKEGRTVYYCHGCDFRAEHDEQTGDYRHFAGEQKAPGRSTMLEFDI